MLNFILIKRFLVLLFLFVGFQLYSQNKISGIITDKNTNEPLFGVQVYIPALQRGCLSDLDGHYLMKNIPDGNFSIQFSYLGYQTFIQKIGSLSEIQNLDISLIETYILSEEIVVSAGAYSSQHENAIKIESISAEALQQESGLSLIENLSHIPGISMVSKGKGVVSPVIRGLSTSNIIMLNNGVRLENFQFSVNHPYMVDDAGVSRVEIIKGPASLLYGSNAIGGVINVIPERPAEAESIIGNAYMKYFSNTQGIQTNIGVKGSGNSLFWGIRASQKSHKDYQQANGETVPNSRFNQKDAHLFTGWHKNKTSFKLSYNYNEMQLGLVIPQAIAVMNDNSREIKDWFQDLHNHILISKNQLFLNTWEIEANLSYQNNHRLLRTTAENTHYILTDMLLQTINYELKGHWDISEKQDFIVGYQGMHQDNKNGIAPQHVLPNYSQTDHSLLVLYQHSSQDKTHIQIGLRYDMRQLLIPEQKASGMENDHRILATLQKKYQNISVSAGLTHQINKQLLLRFNLASAYRIPNVAELTQNGFHANRYEIGNRDLMAQRNYEIDFSAHYHIRSLSFDLAFFYNRIQNYIYLSPTADTTDQGIKIYKYEQNHAFIYGLESSLEYVPYKWFNIKTSYSYLLAKQDDGQYLPFIPQNKWLLNFKITKEKLGLFDHFFFKIRNELVFKQNYPSLFETRTEAYYLLHASVGSTFKVKNQNIIWQISVHNALNEEYIDHLSTLKPLGYLNMGRQFSVSIKIPFSIKSKL